MAALKPYIYRCYDHRAKYKVGIPVTDNPLGLWLELTLAQSYYDNAVPANQKSIGTMSVGLITVGHAHPGSITTFFTPTPFTRSAGAAWAAEGGGTDPDTYLGKLSNHYSLSTWGTGYYVEATLPAGHNRFAFAHWVNAAITPLLRIALAGVTLEDKVYTAPSGGAEYIDTLVYDVAPSAVDRTIRVTQVTSGGTKVLYPISIRTWDTTTRADPRTSASDKHTGNSFMEYMMRMRAAVALGSLIHFPADGGGDWWRLNKPNTFEPIIHFCPTGSDATNDQRWFALGHPHYGADAAGGDRAWFTTVKPDLWIDGVQVTADMTLDPGSGGLAYGRLYEADEIVITQQGTDLETGTLTAKMSHSFTSDAIACVNCLLWGDDSPVPYVSDMYGTCISGTGDTTQVGGRDNYARIDHTFKVPNDPTKYPTRVNATIRSALCDISVPGCPVDLRLATLGQGAFLSTFLNVSKVYTNYTRASYPSPVDGVPWVLGSIVRPILRPVDPEVFIGEVR